MRNPVKIVKVQIINVQDCRSRNLKIGETLFQDLKNASHPHEYRCIWLKQKRKFVFIDNRFFFFPFVYLFLWGGGGGGGGRLFIIILLRRGAYSRGGAKSRNYGKQNTWGIGKGWSSSYPVIRVKRRLLYI